VWSIPLNRPGSRAQALGDVREADPWLERILSGVRRVIAVLGEREAPCPADHNSYRGALTPSGTLTAYVRDQF